MIIGRYILCIKSLTTENIRHIVDTVYCETGFGGLTEEHLLSQLYRPITLVFVPRKKYVYQSVGITTYKDESALVYSYGANGEGLYQLLKDIEKAKKEAELLEDLKRRYNRQIERKAKRINKLEELNKSNFGWHDLGYLQGSITAMENILDTLEEWQ